MGDPYVSMDDAGAFEAALRLLETSLERLSQDPAWIYWAVLGAHATAQTALVLHLSGSMQLGALHRDDVQYTKEYLEAPNECRAYFTWREPRLATFNELLDRLKRKDCWDRPGGPITLRSETIRILRSLNDDRNQVVHFVPVHWSYPKSRLKERVAAVLELVDAIEAEPSKSAFKTFHRKDLSVSELTRAVRRWTTPGGEPGAM